MRLCTASGADIPRQLSFELIGGGRFGQSGEQVSKVELRHRLRSIEQRRLPRQHMRFLARPLPHLFRSLPSVQTPPKYLCPGILLSIARIVYKTLQAKFSEGAPGS